jgi:hypothetical protein
MKMLSALPLCVVLAAPVLAGEMMTTTSAKSPAPAPAAEEPAPYEAGRGLLTTEGPSGLFMNPTSATLPQGAFTAQYCFFLPENDSSPWGHGYMAAYGVTDWAEIGVIGLYVDRPGEDPFATGPFARVRLLKDEGWVPQFSIGGYSRFGDDATETIGLFGAFYKRLPLDEDGVFKSLGFHAGVRQNWLDGPDDPFRVYGGIELQLPLRLYLVGEVSSQDEDVETDVPYSFGLQWRAGGINISVAGIQNGNLDDPGFYFGIGSQFSF